MRSEFGITAVETTELLNNNSWGISLKGGIVSILKEAQKDVPQGKSLGFDVGEAIRIIEKSDTPKNAKEQLAKELKVKLVALRESELDKIKENELSETGEDAVNTVLRSLSL